MRKVLKYNSMRYVLTFCLFVWSSMTMAYNKRNDARFSLTINKESSLSQRIMVRLNRNPITLNYSETETSFADSKNNIYHFDVAVNNYHTYMSLWTEKEGQQVLYAQLIEQGDNINIVFFGSEKPLQFYGSNIAKYVCVQELKIVDETFPQNQYRGEVWNAKATSINLLNQKLKILKKFRSKIHPNIYQIIEADCIGASLLQVLNVISPLKENDESADRTPIDQYSFIANYCDTVFQSHNISDSAACFSMRYGEYLFRDAFYAAWLKSGEPTLHSLKERMTLIEGSKQGLIRDRIMTRLLTNGSEQYSFQFEDPDLHKALLIKVLNRTKIPEFKIRIEDALSRAAKGGNPFNFTFPADTTGKLVTLSDFKGKVVLIDNWGFPCTGCLKFSKAFHKDIYPSFKDNPEFKVVSIMNYGTRQKQLELLRSSRPPFYTYPDYVNLYADENSEMQKNMSNYHQIDAFPFLLLIDKRGKIAATMIWIDGTDPLESEGLKNLIDKLLREPV